MNDIIFWDDDLELYVVLDTDNPTPEGDPCETYLTIEEYNELYGEPDA